VFASYLLSSLLFTVSLQNEIPKKECTQYKCSDTFGHFDYRSFYKAYPRQQQQFKMLQSEKPTTIVVHIKNIKKNSDNWKFLYVCNPYWCKHVRAGADRMIVFRNVTKVCLVKSDLKSTFEVDYYIGCGFLQGNIQIDHSVSVSNRPLCWVTIPRIEKVVDQQAHSIYAYIDDYGKLNGKLSIYNMLTGKHFKSEAYNRQVFKHSALSSPRTFLFNTLVTSVILITASDCPTVDCSDLKFRLHLLQMSEAEDNCIQKKKNCQYNVNNKFNMELCKEIYKLSCPAFKQLNALIYSKNVVKDKKKKGFDFAAYKDCYPFFNGKEHLYFCDYKGNDSQKLSENCREFRSCIPYCLGFVLQGGCKKAPNIIH